MGRIVDESGALIDEYEEMSKYVNDLVEQYTNKESPITPMMNSCRVVFECNDKRTHFLTWREGLDTYEEAKKLGTFYTLRLGFCDCEDEIIWHYTARITGQA